MQPRMQTCTFSELSAATLYEIIWIRQEILVDEANNAKFVDIDDEDQNTLHVLCWQEADAHQKMLIAYARLIMPDYLQDRLVVIKQFRDTELSGLFYKYVLAQIAAKKPYELTSVPAAVKTGWQWLTFSEFDAGSLLQVLKMRIDTFVLEQGYAYNDLDHRDQQALHLVNFEEKDGSKKLTACARLMQPEYNHGELEVGRVFVRKDLQCHGLGSELMKRVLAKIDNRYPVLTSCLTIIEDKFSLHLPKFYGKFGYKKVGASGGEHYTYKNFKCVLWRMERAPVGDEKKTDDRNERNTSINTPTLLCRVD